MTVSAGLQALMLMYQLLAGRNAVSERFYRALYTVLLTEGATGAAGEGHVMHMGGGARGMWCGV
jgi:hypothetical protein